MNEYSGRRAKDFMRRSLSQKLFYLAFNHVNRAPSSSIHQNQPILLRLQHTIHPHWSFGSAASSTLIQSSHSVSSTQTTCTFNPLYSLYFSGFALALTDQLSSRPVVPMFNLICAYSFSFCCTCFLGSFTPTLPSSLGKCKGLLIMYLKLTLISLLLRTHS